MQHPGSDTPVYNSHANTPAATVLVAGRDFITPDGTLVPHALGEAGLRRRTAILVGGMLVGNWPESV